jgi:hypothetical protein
VRGKRCRTAIPDEHAGHRRLARGELEWVDWFNHRRLLEAIGNVPPAELESAYSYRQRQELTMAA